jgi:hypothetical protein
LLRIQDRFIRFAWGTGCSSVQMRCARHNQLHGNLTPHNLAGLLIMVSVSGVTRQRPPLRPIPCGVISISSRLPFMVLGVGKADPAASAKKFLHDHRQGDGILVNNVY